MGHRAGEIDVGHALTTNFRLRDFNAALLTNNTAVLQALVLAAQALVVLDRTKDFGAKQTVTLRFERTIVDGLRLLDLAIRPGANHVGRSQSDANRIEVFVRRL